MGKLRLTTESLTQQAQGSGPSQQTGIECLLQQTLEGLSV